MDAALVSEQNVPLILQGIRVDGPSVNPVEAAVWQGRVQFGRLGFDVDQAIPIAGDAHDRHMWMSVLPAYY
jgi:hypothetical protein